MYIYIYILYLSITDTLCINIYIYIFFGRNNIYIYIFMTQFHRISMDWRPHRVMIHRLGGSNTGWMNLQYQLWPGESRTVHGVWPPNWVLLLFVLIYVWPNCFHVYIYIYIYVYIYIYIYSSDIWYMRNSCREKDPAVWKHLRTTLHTQWYMEYPSRYIYIYIDGGFRKWGLPNHPTTMT